MFFINTALRIMMWNSQKIWLDFAFPLTGTNEVTKHRFSSSILIENVLFSVLSIGILGQPKLVFCSASFTGTKRRKPGSELYSILWTIYIHSVGLLYYIYINLNSLKKAEQECKKDTNSINLKTKKQKTVHHFTVNYSKNT